MDGTDAVDWASKRMALKSIQKISKILEESQRQANTNASPYLACYKVHEYAWWKGFFVALGISIALQCVFVGLSL